MAKLGVGVIGCGFVGYGAHVPAFSAIEQASLVAVADPDPKRLDKAARKYSVPAAYQDYTDLVKDPAVQAVVVSVPTPLHAKAALAAIAAGKHVLCEMPLTPTLEQADALIDAAKKAGVCLMPGLNFRFTPNYVKAKQMVTSGALGSVTAVMYREFIPAKDLAKQWPPGAWMWKVDQSGGPLFTLAVWSIDLVQWIAESKIAAVHGFAKYTALGQFGGTLGYDASATVRFDNGVVGSLQYSGSICEPATSSCLEVVGSATTMLSAGGNDTDTLVTENPVKTEWKTREPGAKLWGHQQQDEHFVDCLLAGKPPQIAPEDGRRAMEVALAIAKSGAA